MFRFSSLLLVILLNLAEVRAQTRPAPLYALPADGTWVEYGWTFVARDGGKQAGLLRISSVGTKELKGRRYRWIEMRRQTGQGAEAKVRIRKVLVEEAAMVGGRPFAEAVAEGYKRDAADGPIVRLSGRQLEDVLGMGFEGQGAELQTTQAKVIVKTELGSFSTRRVVAGSPKDKRGLEYHGWLTGRVPFGWVKLEIHEKSGARARRLVFRAVAIKSGKGAQSGVAESEKE
jgi:hypothetical protein